MKQTVKLVGGPAFEAKKRRDDHPRFHTLRVAQLEAFQAWCTTNGVEWRDMSDRGDKYIVCQVRPKAHYWLGIHKSERNPLALSLDNKLMPTVLRFLKETNQ